MASQKLKQAAPKLLAAVKFTVGQLVSTPDLTQEVRAAILNKLNDAIEEAEEQEWLIEFVITPRTSELIYKFLNEPGNWKELSQDLQKWLRDGQRITTRRVYYRLPVDVALAEQFIRFLRTTNPGTATSRAFDRIADQVAAEIERSPLALLATLGL